MRPIQAKDLTGSMVALITPMHTDGSINYNQWTQVIKWHISCGTTAVVVAGTTGESALLETAEIEQLTRTAVELCQDTDTAVIVGTGAVRPDKVIIANQQAQHLGADAVLVVTPYYLTLTQQALVNHFNQIADQTELPIILYNVPGRTGNDLSHSSTTELAKHEKIIGIKEAKADMDRIKQLVKIKDFAVLSGDDGSFVKAMTLGAHGVISVAANARPKSIKNICNYMQLGHVAEAEKLNEQLNAFYDYLFHEPNPGPVKTILHAAEIIDQGIRRPFIWSPVKTSDSNKYLKYIRQEYNPL